MQESCTKSTVCSRHRYNHIFLLTLYIFQFSKLHILFKKKYAKYNVSRLMTIISSQNSLNNWNSKICSSHIAYFKKTLQTFVAIIFLLNVFTYKYDYKAVIRAAFYFIFTNIYMSIIIDTNAFLRPNLKNLSRGLNLRRSFNLRRGSNMIVST